MTRKSMLFIRFYSSFSETLNGFQLLNFANILRKFSLVKIHTPSTRFFMFHSILSNGTQNCLVIYKDYTFLLLEDSPARFVIEIGILIMSDRDNRESEVVGELGVGMAWNGWVNVKPQAESWWGSHAS